jgi:hypothetical protein
MRYFRILCWMVVLVAMIAGIRSARAQNDPNFDTGFKPFGAYHGGNIDHVNLTNGGLNVDIPLMSYPQKGKLKLSYTLHYENFGDYSNVIYVTTQGGYKYHYWADWGHGALVHSFAVILDDVPVLVRSTHTPYNSATFANSVQVNMSDGSMHGMAPTSLDALTWETTDATGIRVTNTGTFDSNGILYTAPNGYFAMQDPNGNQITSGPSGITDSMNRTIPNTVATTDYSKCTGQNLHAITSAKIWTLPGLNGGSYPILFCYTSASETDPIGGLVTTPAALLRPLTPIQISYKAWFCSTITRLGPFNIRRTLTMTWQRSRFPLAARYPTLGLQCPFVRQMSIQSIDPLLRAR